MSETISASAKYFVTADQQRLSLEAYVDQLKKQHRLTETVNKAIDKARAIRLGHELVFYLAGALTGMPDSVKHRYQSLSDIIATYNQPGVRMFGYAPHLHGTDPVTHPDVTPAEVRDIDYLFAAVVPDGHINFVHPVAHGNALEEAWAEAGNIPAMYIVPDGVTVSRLMRGMYNVVGTITYSDFGMDGLPQVAEFLDELQTLWHESRAAS